MRVALAEWNAYRIGDESKRENWTNNSCRPFDDVYHVAHRRAALHIIEDRRIRAGLVYDRGILKTKRIGVSWVSPNTWGLGSRYGNVEFRFPFAALLERKNAYWVEVITDYKIPALRFLITDQDRSAIATPYDPTARDGPWWYDESRKAHFFNGDDCVEFMIEGDVPLADCEGIDFVSHHANYCCENRMNPSSCPDLDLSKGRAGSLFLARLLGQNYPIEQLGLTSDRVAGRVASATFAYGMSSFLMWVHHWVEAPYGTVDASPGLRSGLARAVLAAYGEERMDDAKALLAAFGSKEDFFSALSDVLTRRLGVDTRPDLGLDDYM